MALRWAESKDNGNPPELMEHQKKLFDMLSGESGNKEESSSRLRNADQYGGNDRIDRSPNDRALDNIKLVSLSSEYPQLFLTNHAAFHCSNN